MDPSLSLETLAFLALALGLAGVVTGFLSGLLGIGGGGVLMPVLYEAFGIIGVDPSIRMHMALGTSLAVVAPTTLRSYLSHRTRGTPDAGLLRRLGPWMVVGVMIGILTARYSSGDTLKWVWVVCGGLLALKMAFGRDDWKLGADIPRGWAAEAYVVLVGIVSVLMSIAGAAFMVAFMTLYGRPLLQSVGTSAGFGPMIAVPGALGLAWAGWDSSLLPPGSLGYVSLIGAALIIPASVLTAPLGVRIAHGISKRALELAFALFLALVALRFLISLLG
ncbi:MAG: sulfite exporter TauE/SafE family protein [Hyphomicrobiaceae bacterium]|nr:sulfite exporter TauE/SafE family protein [Hyphomicrobiaceae bacterium]